MKAQLSLQPALQQLLATHGLDSFDTLFNLAGGDVISGHPARNVATFELGPWSGFLKREFWVPWKVRLLNWWAGFGWVSKAAREWQVLHGLRALGIHVPEPLGFGENRGQAFLLVRRLENHFPLVDFVNQLDQDRRRSFAEALGAAVARFHEAGYDHPDLYAKHVFVHETTGAIAFLDLQRTRRYRSVPWRRRFRDLAALHASLAESVVARQERWYCLRSYLQACHGACSRPLERRAFRAIACRAYQLLRRRKVQGMRNPLLPAHVTQVEVFRVAVQEDGALLLTGTSNEGRFASPRTRR